MPETSQTPFALFRLPGHKEATLIRQTEGTPAELLSPAELATCSGGFVMAPFDISAQQPIVVIRPDTVEEVELGQLKGPSPLTLHPSPFTTHPSPLTRDNYAADFAAFHGQLQRGTFSKIVLARCAEEDMGTAVRATALFVTACNLYPDMFVALASSPKSGTWLTATPEILLEGRGDRWHTIALAGTMKVGGTPAEQPQWSEKNRQEQRIVATYISDCLKRHAADVSEEGPYTVRAAGLLHLRSDFTFSLPGSGGIGALLNDLHPTPAVCGLPKGEAFGFITAHEHTPRRYYSGFMGPLGEETHLYVSLRCMSIEGCRCHLYAGGGLLKDSTEEQEWQETEAKLETMRKVINV